MEIFLSVLTIFALISTLIFFIIFIVHAVKKQNKRQSGIIALLSLAILITVSLIGSQLYPVKNKETQLNPNASNDRKDIENGNRALLENQATLTINANPILVQSQSNNGWTPSAGVILRATSDTPVDSLAIMFKIVDERNNEIKMPRNVNSWFENVPSISLTIPANTAMIPNEKGLSIENIVFKFVVDGTVYSKNVGIGSKFIVSKLDNGKYKLYP